MKRFVAKKYKRKRKNKLYLILAIILVYYLARFKNDKNILNNNYKYINSNIFKNMEIVIKNTINNPSFFLDYYDNSYYKETDTNLVYKSNNKPIIYIYNTHQSEEYSNYSVYELSEYLSEELDKSLLPNYFERQSIKTYLNNNSYSYSKSYKASKYYMENAKKKYSSLNYFIDIHRDSVSKSIATITYNNKSYAKVLFIVGLENKNYKDNLKNTEKLNATIKKKVPNISRGIMKKQGKGVNGIYNQDFSSNVFLIEVGTKDSTKEEVLNTINVLKESIIEYIGGY